MALLNRLLKPLSLLKLATLALLCVLTAIALTAGATYYLLHSVDANAQLEQTKLLAELVSARAHETLRTYQEPLRRLAQQPDTAALLAADKALPRLAKAQQLKTGLPDVLQVFILPTKEFSEPAAAECLEPLGANHGKDGLHRLRYHVTEKQGQHIDLIETIPSPVDGTPLGAILINIDNRVLQEILERSLPADGQLTLRQPGGRDGNEVVATAGPAPRDGWHTTAAAVPQAPWKLQLAKNPRAPGLSGAQTFIYLLLVAIAALIAIVGTVYVHYLTVHAVNNDIRSIARVFKDMRDGNVRVDYPIEFSDFKRFFSYLRDSGMKMVLQHQQLRSMGMIDHLSQLHNRRAFETRLATLFERVKSAGPSSLLIIDLDHFKQVNDTHGHDVGDNLIVGFSEALKRLVRNTDFLARLGGDEFCIIFPHIGVERALNRVAQLRQDLPKLIALSPTYQHPLRWTGGLAVMQDDDRKSDDVLKRADQALFKAKEAGRNRSFYFQHPHGVRAT